MRTGLIWCPTRALHLARQSALISVDRWLFSPNQGRAQYGNYSPASRGRRTQPNKEILTVKIRADFRPSVLDDAVQLLERVGGLADFVLGLGDAHDGRVLSEGGLEFVHRLDVPLEALLGRGVLEHLAQVEV